MGDGVPSRIQAVIAQQQDASERLTAWIQFGIVLFFAVLYSVAPKTYTGDLMYPPVTMALAAFVAAAVLRLVVAHRGRAPGWFVGGLIVVDMTLLLLLIWSFHIQYEQPPAFSLKAPTLLYVFIFIALRTLRFEVRYVILAGGTAAVGWMILASWAVFADPGMVTRDYVYYLTANAVLIGAEIDKVITILVVTGVLSLALARARRLLVQSVVEAAAARDLSRFFAPGIANRITGAEHQVLPGHGEAREASILTVDIRGFTQLSKTLPPSDLIGVLVEYQSRMIPAIQKHGGSIDKFLGDGILATFGAVLPSETHAADALRALEAVIAAADEWSRDRVDAGATPLVLGAAVVAGDVVFGAVGDESRLEYTVIGDAVNFAAKLEKHNKAIGARATAPGETYDLAVSQGYRPAMEPDRLPSVEIGGAEGTVEVAVVSR
ncbi:MAG: adenylate/guanylate cyclase domain-containing protein [Proteobacteria bacterium]|nr:adenylate/guanylate cyclase domain-containing protein [Pseudomonadota bacterium]